MFSVCIEKAKLSIIMNAYGFGKHFFGVIELSVLVSGSHSPYLTSEVSLQLCQRHVVLYFIYILLFITKKNHIKH